MLQLLNVQEIREHAYLVTLDRDGAVLEYEFTWNPSRNPDGFAHVYYPEHAAYDLVDYEPEEHKNQPGGALWIPPLAKVSRLIHRIVDGQIIDYPVMFDER